MDFDLDDVQTHRHALLEEMSARYRRPLPSSGLPGDHDDGFVGAIRAETSLVGSDLILLDRVLLVEQAARIGVAFNPTAELLIAPLVDGRVAQGPIAIVIDGAAHPVRGGADAGTVIALDSSSAWSGVLGAGERAAAASGFGSSYGVVSIDFASAAAWTSDASPIFVYRLGLAAEIAGAACGAIDHTAAHLTARKAFGRPLGTFQALRHRLSELAVDVAGASALVRNAAWLGDDASIAGAVAYAAATAAHLPPELHQLCGARGFVSEFGLSRWTMLLQALRVELGGVDTTSAQYAEARWA